MIIYDRNKLESLADAASGHRERSLSSHTAEEDSPLQARRARGVHAGFVAEEMQSPAPRAGAGLSLSCIHRNIDFGFAPTFRRCGGEILELLSNGE